MVVLIIAICFGLLIIGMSVLANARFRQETQLPMQWSLTGSVNWSAPRLVALSFTPAVAIGAMTIVVALAMTLRPRLGQDNMVVPSLIFMGSVFVAVHALHIWLCWKTLHRNNR